MCCYTIVGDAPVANRTLKFCGAELGWFVVPSGRARGGPRVAPRRRSEHVAVVAGSRIAPRLREDHCGTDSIMAFNASSCTWSQQDWRIPTGDARYCSASDALNHTLVMKNETESAHAFRPAASPGRDSLDAYAIRAVLAHSDVGVVHRGAARPELKGKPSYNPIFRSSCTASTWMAPPEKPYTTLPARPDLTPVSKMHRQLGTSHSPTGSPRVA